ncbi:sensor histidine kinase [Thiomicrorhabdus cannonii]|uniref:sensor histidine kinase n=1 Tax=Thiomicrorhabdus cannonii TaxID=2748011 RepID=UPI0015BB8AF4|nr:sensor histidine kinase [Thiomicrorhabdus cannonii]
MQSLQKQLTYGLTLSLAAIFVVFWWVTTYTIHQLTERYIVTRLEHDAETLIKHLSLENGRWQMGENAAEVIYQRPLSGHYYLVKSDNPLIASLSSPSMGDFPLYSPINSPAGSYETRAPGDTEALVLHTRFNVHGYEGHLFVAEDHTPIRQALRWFDGIFALFSLLGLILLLWSQRKILQRGFDTLQPVRAALGEVQQGKEVSIHTEVPAEIMPLVETLNQALSQLHARLARSRQATGNLAHALKSPLNLIYQLLDDTRLQAHPELQQRLQEQAKRVLDLIERELGLARTAGSGMVLNAFRFPDDLDDLLQTLQSLYRDKSLRFECHVALQEATPFDREDMFELLGNLLDNAAKWSRTHIRIVVKQALFNQQPCLLMQIEDDGSGVSAADVLAMQQRGARLDESQPGHGLGLSIVAQVVAAYGGEVKYGSGERWLPHEAALSGLQVTVRLPL